jgi:hypothetical protein
MPRLHIDNGEGQAMAETTGSSKRVERPLSPHLQIYRIQITSVSSILTRITGHALIAGVILGTWWLLAAATSDSYFAVANAVVTSWCGTCTMMLATGWRSRRPNVWAGLA